MLSQDPLGITTRSGPAIRLCPVEHRAGDMKEQSWSMAGPEPQHHRLHGLLRGLDAERRPGDVPGGERRLRLGHGADGDPDRDPGPHRLDHAAAPGDAHRPVRRQASVRAAHAPVRRAHVLPEPGRQLQRLPARQPGLRAHGHLVRGRNRFLVGVVQSGAAGDRPRHLRRRKRRRGAHGDGRPRDSDGRSRTGGRTWTAGDCFHSTTPPCSW